MLYRNGTIFILLKNDIFFIFQSPHGMYTASAAIDGINNKFDVASGKLVHTLEGIIWSVS